MRSGGIVDLLVDGVRGHFWSFFFIPADPQHIGKGSSWIQGSALPDKRSWRAAWP